MNETNSDSSIEPRCLPNEVGAAALLNKLLARMTALTLATEIQERGLMYGHLKIIDFCDDQSIGLLAQRDQSVSIYDSLWSWYFAFRAIILAQKLAHLEVSRSPKHGSVRVFQTNNDLGKIEVEVEVGSDNVELTASGLHSLNLLLAAAHQLGLLTDELRHTR